MSGVMFNFGRLPNTGIGPTVIIDGAGARPVRLRRRRLHQHRTWMLLREFMLLGGGALLIMMLLVFSLLGWAEAR